MDEIAEDILSTIKYELLKVQNQIDEIKNEISELKEKIRNENEPN